MADRYFFARRRTRSVFDVAGLSEARDGGEACDDEAHSEDCRAQFDCAGLGQG